MIRRGVCKRLNSVELDDFASAVRDPERIEGTWTSSLLPVKPLKTSDLQVMRTELRSGAWCACYAELVPSPARIAVANVRDIYHPNKYTVVEREMQGKNEEKNSDKKWQGWDNCVCESAGGDVSTPNKG